MTIEISKETEALLQKVMSSGGFDNAEQLLQYSLTRTLSEQDILEDDVFVSRVKASLGRAETAIKEGRVHSIPHGKLADTIAERNKDRSVSH